MCIFNPFEIYLIFEHGIRSSLILSLSRWRNSCTSTIYVKIHHSPTASLLKHINSSRIFQLFSGFLIWLGLSLSLCLRQHHIYTITNCSDILEYKSNSRKSSFLVSFLSYFWTFTLQMWYLRLFYLIPRENLLRVSLKLDLIFILGLGKCIYNSTSSSPRTKYAFVNLL